MRKKTEAEKALSGTNRKDRAPKKSARVVTINDIPSPQPYVKGPTLKIYKILAEHLVQHGCLRQVDTLYLSMSALAFFMFPITVKELENNGYAPVMVHESGSRQVAAEISALKSMIDTINKCADNLGLHPKSRERIQAFANDSKKDKKDPFAEILARRSAE